MHAVPTQVGVPLLHQQQPVSAASGSCNVQEGVKSFASQHLNYSCEEDAPVKPSLLKRAFSAPPTLLSFFKPAISSSTAIKTERGSIKAPSPSLLPLFPYSQRGRSSGRSTSKQRSIASFLKGKSPQQQEVVLLDDDSQEDVCVSKPVKDSEEHCSDPSGSTPQEGELIPRPSECAAESQDSGCMENDSSCSASASLSKLQKQPSLPTVQQASQDANPTSAGPVPQGAMVASPAGVCAVAVDQTSTPSSGDGDAKGGHSSHRPGCKKEAEWGTDPCKSPITTSESTSSDADEGHKVRPSKRKSACGMSTCEGVWSMDCGCLLENSSM